MGAWGELAFDNDTANDWAYGLDDASDLSLVESAFDELEEVGDDYLDQTVPGPGCASFRRDRPNSRRAFRTAGVVGGRRWR